MSTDCTNDPTPAVPHLYSVSPHERDVLESLRQTLMVAQCELGAELERHDRIQTLLLKRVAEARAAYGGSIAAFSRQTVSTPGRFEYRPELGAFVASKE